MPRALGIEREQTMILNSFVQFVRRTHVRTSTRMTPTLHRNLQSKVGGEAGKNVENNKI